MAPKKSMIQKAIKKDHELTPLLLVFSKKSFKKDKDTAYVETIMRLTTKTVMVEVK